MDAENPFRERFQFDSLAKELGLPRLLGLPILCHQQREDIDDLAISGRKHFGSLEVRVGSKDAMRQEMGKFGHVAVPLGQRRFTETCNLVRFIVDTFSDGARRARPGRRGKPSAARPLRA